MALDDGAKRNAIISAANLLMVSLLKLNRVLVPSLLRFFRSRRRNWILRASEDVARELADSPDRRRLCVGSCCGGGYGAVVSAVTATPQKLAMSDTYRRWTDVTPSHFTTPLSSAPTLPPLRPADARPTGSNSAIDVETGPAQRLHNASQRLILQDADGNMLVKLPPGWTEDDLYFRLRVMEEERHRANKVQPIVFSSVMYTYFTLLSLIVYASVIVYIVLATARFDSWEALIFSFSLIATATISEAETLLHISKKYNVPPVFMPKTDSHAQPAAETPVNAATDNVAQRAVAGAAMDTATRAAPATAENVSADGRPDVTERPMELSRQADRALHVAIHDSNVDPNAADLLDEFESDFDNDV